MSGNDLKINHTSYNIETISYTDSLVRISFD